MLSVFRRRKNNRIIFLFIIEKHNNDQSNCRKRNINISHIKNWKINQTEIKEIDNIIMYNSIDQITNCSSEETDQNNIKR